LECFRSQIGRLQSLHKHFELMQGCFGYGALKRDQKAIS